MKTKRSRNHEKRQRARLMREIAKHDPDYAFQCAVLEKHPNNHMLRLRLRELQNASMHAWQTYITPNSAADLNVLMCCGGGGGGGGASGQHFITVTPGTPITVTIGGKNP